MSRARIQIVLVTAVLGALAAYGAATPETGPVSFTGFQLAGGFNAEGWKTWDISGREAHMASADAREVEITGLSVHLFNGKADLAVETNIESPRATVTPREDSARGNGALLITGASYQVTGSNWAWNGTTHIINVNRNVMVKFSPAATAGRGAAAAKPSQPIVIESSTLVINQDPVKNQGRNQFIFAGNVTVTDGNCSTVCRELEVLAARDILPDPRPTGAALKPATPAPPDLGVGSIERIIARGQVLTRDGDLEARGDQVELIPGANRVIISGGPRVADLSNDALVEGSRITWDRETDVVLVDPMPASLDTPPMVRVSMPSLALQQKNPGAQPNSRLVITSESLRADFGLNPRRLDFERSVRVSDPQLTVFAGRLEAEFDAPASPPPPVSASLPAARKSEVGQLRHLTASADDGNVTIYQDHRITTTKKAEIFPALGEILLNGDPRVEDTYGGGATVLGGRITLYTDEKRAFVESVPGRRTQVIMSSLPDIGAGAGVRDKTEITSDTLAMQRERDPTFSFAGEVHVQSGNLSVDCGNIEITTRQSAHAEAGGPMEGLGNIGEITGLIARNHVSIKQGNLEARAARTEIYPRVNVTEGEGDGGDKSKPYRFIENFGDPTGVLGPVRPQVVLPMKDMGLMPLSGGNATTETKANAPVVISSDEQKLLTSPAGNIYMFSGNVQIEGVNFRGNCNEVIVSSKPAGDGELFAIEKITARGGVRIAQADPASRVERVVTSGLAVITPENGNIVLSENVIIPGPDGKPSERVGTVTLTRDPNGQYTTAIVGEPGKRPSFNVPRSPQTTFDNFLKPANKPATRPTP